MAKSRSIQELRDSVGSEMGCSDWVHIDQALINSFADATMDHQYIHVDPERATAGPFGTTIAHGLLTLSLLPLMMESISYSPEGATMFVNYGFDRVRFINPVKVGSDVRGRAVLSEVSERNKGQWMLKMEITVEIRDVEKPALVAEWLTMSLVDS